ncbi:MAG: hypothetical protein WC635_10830 [Bacteriovorax sp.]|jgi:hypothetical protein
MTFSEWYYIPIAASVSSVFTFIWQKKIGHKQIQGIKTLGLIFFGAILNCWGMDVLQRMVDVTTFNQMMQVSLGCWIYIAAATSAKHYALHGWSKKSFWIDYGGDLASFLLMGSIIYALT